MQRGDLSNEVVPKLLIVFEGAIGYLPEDKRRMFEKAMGKGHWDDACACWDLNDLMLRKIWDVVARQSREVEVITYLGKDFADTLAGRLDVEDVPVHAVWATDPASLSRKLAYMPSVSAVYDPDPAHQFTYGAKGRVLTSVHDFGG
jgi:hypothetical protein